jgi:flavin-dependent thymidylate synthase
MTDDRRFAQAEKSVVVLRSDMRVELVDSMGDDTSVVRAAKVSTAGQGAARYVQHEQAADGLIGYLMRNRHGSPFEHTAFTFYVEAPIFVWREIMRHRIASYNEESGRYRKLEPVFYVPAASRPVRQGGTSAHPRLTAGTEAQHELVDRELIRASDGGLQRVRAPARGRRRPRGGPDGAAREHLQLGLRDHERPRTDELPLAARRG